MSPYKKLNIKVKQAIANYENGEYSKDEYQRILTALYQEHLKLNESTENQEQKELLKTMLFSG